MRSRHFLLMLLLASLSLVGCAQRVSLNETHGLASKRIFFQQGNAPIVQLAPVTSEDAKRISAAREKRSGGTVKSGRSQRFSFGGGNASNTIGLE